MEARPEGVAAWMKVDVVVCTCLPSVFLASIQGNSTRLVKLIRSAGLRRKGPTVQAEHLVETAVKFAHPEPANMGYELATKELRFACTLHPFPIPPRLKIWTLSPPRDELH